MLHAVSVQFTVKFTEPSQLVALVFSIFLSLYIFLYLHSSLPPPPNKITVGPIFSISDPTIREGEQLVVRLSAPILTRSFAPLFTGRIEVDITAEDLPAGDSRLRATLGKYCFT